MCSCTWAILSDVFIMAAGLRMSGSMLMVVGTGLYTSAKGDEGKITVND
jgi:hypothetical protein